MSVQAVGRVAMSTGIAYLLFLFLLYLRPHLHLLLHLHLVDLH